RRACAARRACPSARGSRRSRRRARRGGRPCGGRQRGRRAGAAPASRASAPPASRRRGGRGGRAWSCRRPAVPGARRPGAPRVPRGGRAGRALWEGRGTRGGREALGVDEVPMAPGLSSSVLRLSRWSCVLASPLPHPSLMVTAAVARREVRATLVLAVPLVLTQLAQMTMSFVDVIMIGRLGAGVVGSSTFFTLLVLCVGMGLAVNPSVARPYGAGDEAEVGRCARQGLWLGVFLGVPLVALFGYAEPLLRAAGQEPATAALAADYLRAIRWGVLPNLWFAALRSLCEGTGRPRPVLVVMLIAAGVNVLC